MIVLGSGTLAGRVLGPKLVIDGVLTYGIVYRFFMWRVNATNRSLRSFGTLSQTLVAI